MNFVQLIMLQLEYSVNSVEHKYIGVTDRNQRRQTRIPVPVFLIFLTFYTVVLICNQRRQTRTCTSVSNISHFLYRCDHMYKRYRYR